MAKINNLRKTYFILLLLMFTLAGHTQMITGVWQGKINRQKAEVKIIQRGDSLTGTSYYYESPTHYRRYSIKGFFDVNTNEAVWWDDKLIEERSGKNSTPGKVPLLSRADFNCPGGGRMMLDGKAGKIDDEHPRGDVHLDKTGESTFMDEWDNVIDNYLAGGNDPDLIDSVSTITARQPVVEGPAETTIEEKPMRPVIIKEEPKAAVPIPEPARTQTLEEKFATRKKTIAKEIPISGDSIELRFYDNAEIDGDSISLFLNDKLIFQHIRLTEKPYIIKLAVNELNDTNELTMVAENLGSIPPNTSYMIVWVGETRYDARLESTEGSSAVVKFVKKSK